MRQHLLLRGSRDFESEADYERFLHQVLEGGHRGRQENLAREMAAMKPLPPTRLSEYDEVNCTVGSASTIRVKKVGYSVPARLMGQELKVEVCAGERKLYRGRELLLVLPRQGGERGGAGEYLRLLKLASEVGESDLEVMLADDLSPPYPAWSVGELRRILQPEPKPQMELSELQPEGRSYDALLSPELEVAYAG